MPRWRAISLCVMATGWLLAFWAWRSGSSPLFWVGLALVALPVPVVLAADGSRLLAAPGRIAPRGSAVARAIEAAVAAVTLGVLGWISISGLERTPPGVFCDEVEIALQSRQLVLDRLSSLDLPLFYQHFQYSHLGALPLYAAAPGIAALGMTDLAIRATPVAWTAVALLVLLRLTRRVGWRHGWIAVAIFALSPVSLHVSRLNFGHAPSLLLSCAGLYAYARARERGSVWWAAGAGLGFGASIYGNAAWYIAAPVMVFALAVGELVAGRRDRGAILSLGAMAAAFALCWAPVIARAWTDPSFMERFRDKGGDGASLLSGDRLATMLDNYPKYFSPRYLFEVGEVGLPGGWNLRHSVPGAGLFPWLVPPLVLLGAVALIRSRPGTGRVMALAGLVMLALYPAPDLLTTTHLNPPYTFAVYPMLLWMPLLAGYAIDRASRWLDGRWRASGPSVTLAVALVAVTLSGTIRFASGPWERYPNVSAGYYGWQYGPEPAIDAFAARRDAYGRFWLDPDYSEARVFIDFYLADADELRERSEVGSFERLDLRERALYAVRGERYDALAQTDAAALHFLRIVDVIRYPNGEIVLYLVDASFANRGPAPAGW